MLLYSVCSAWMLHLPPLVYMFYFQFILLAITNVPRCCYKYFLCELVFTHKHTHTHTYRRNAMNANHRSSPTSLFWAETQVCIRVVWFACAKVRPILASFGGDLLWRAWWSVVRSISVVPCAPHTTMIIVVRRAAQFSGPPESRHRPVSRLLPANLQSVETDNTRLRVY